MSTEADFVFTVNVTMAIEDTATIDDAASIIETAVWDSLPPSEFTLESCYVTGKLA